MTEKSYERAVQALRDRFGARWDIEETEGRDDMVEFLEEQLGYEHDEANDVIDALVESGQIHYRRIGETADDPLPDVPAPPAGVGGIATGATSSGTIGGPPLLGVALRPGFWEIGDQNLQDRYESGQTGRAGQVSPES